MLFYNVAIKYSLCFRQAANLLPFRISYELKCFPLCLTSHPPRSFRLSVGSRFVVTKQPGRTWQVLSNGTMSIRQNQQACAGLPKMSSSISRKEVMISILRIYVKMAEISLDGQNSSPFVYSRFCPMILESLRQKRSTRSLSWSPLQLMLGLAKSGQAVSRPIFLWSLPLSNENKRPIFMNS